MSRLSSLVAGPRPSRGRPAAGLCDAMRRAGAEPDAVLDRFHLSERALEEPSSWLDLADGCGLLERAAWRGGNAAFGWELGLAQGTSALGDVAEVTQQIRDALADGKPGLAPVARRLGLVGPRPVPQAVGLRGG